MLTRPKTFEERLADLARAARPDFNPWHGNPEDQPLPSRAFYAFRDATPPSTILALTAVVAAARLSGQWLTPEHGRVLWNALTDLDCEDFGW